MNKCDGWNRLKHETDKPLTGVFLEPCQICHGAVCGITGDEIRLCPDCQVSVLKAVEETDLKLIREVEPE
jgi:hypothetical protein